MGEHPVNKIAESAERQNSSIGALFEVSTDQFGSMELEGCLAVGNRKTALANGDLHAVYRCREQRHNRTHR